MPFLRLRRSGSYIPGVDGLYQKDRGCAGGWTSFSRQDQRCLRGFKALTAFGLAVEIGDWDRFTCSRIGAYLGLVPTEHSSGVSRSLGSMAKTGNGP